MSMKTSIKELQTLTENEADFRIHERIEEYMGSQGDWKEVMAQKWFLAAEYTYNPFLGGR